MTHYPDPNSLDDDRILALELVRATEAAAVAAARFLGRGDEDQVDAAAVDAMRPVLGTIPMRGVVVIGEGEKDDAPMLYSGEHVGRRDGAAGGRGDRPGRRRRADRQEPAERDVRHRAGRPRGDVRSRGIACIWTSWSSAPTWLGRSTSTRRSRTPWRPSPGSAGKSVADVTVALLDRPRHVELADRIRVAGARIKFLIGGDVAGALMALQPESEVDVLVGVGGTPEGIVAACATACMGGAMFGRLAPRDEQERRQILDAGHDPAAGAHHVGPGQRGQRLLRGHRGHRR